MITDKGVAVPDDMAGVLQKDAEGLAAFEALRPSDQRVYVDWVKAAANAGERSERLSDLARHVQAYQRRPAQDESAPHFLGDTRTERVSR
jgi:uncharacterized protein YdeI (YjbR/CyaY-like superfamily)